MKINRKSVVHMGILAAIACLAALDVAAQSTGGSGQSVGKVATNVAGSLKDSMILVNAVAYLIGGICVFMGILLFKKNREDPRSEPLGKAIGVLLAGVCFLFLPEVLSSGAATVWGGGSTAVNPDAKTLTIK